MAPPAFEGHLNYGIPAKPRGPTERQVMTYQGTMWRLRCSDVSWQTCQAVVFPSNEDLVWLPGHLTPRV